MIILSGRWTAYFNVRPLCNTIVKPSSNIVLGEFKLMFDDEERVFRVELSKELDVDIENKARIILAKHIRKELLPSLILTTNCAMEFNQDNMSLRYEGANSISITINTVVKVYAVSEVGKNPEDFERELMHYHDMIKGLDNITKEWLQKALKFWNKGVADSDPVDKFIYFYIALEIFVKRVLGYSDLNNYVINDIGEKYGVHFEYEFEGNKWGVDKIRNNILHGGTFKAEKVELYDKIVEVASKSSDRFGQDVLNLIKEFLNSNINNN